MICRFDLGLKKKQQEMMQRIMPQTFPFSLPEFIKREDAIDAISSEVACEFASMDFNPTQWQLYFAGTKRVMQRHFTEATDGV